MSWRQPYDPYGGYPPLQRQNQNDHRQQRQNYNFPHHHNPTSGHHHNFIPPDPNQFSFPIGRGYGRGRASIHTGVSGLPQYGFAGRERFPLFTPPQPQQMQPVSHQQMHMGMAENMAYNVNNTVYYPQPAQYTQYTSGDIHAATQNQSWQPYDPYALQQGEDQNQNYDELNKDVEALQAVWDDARHPDKKSKSAAIFKKLASVLSTNSNPWKYTLDLLKSAQDYDLAKAVSLSFQILAQFGKWTNSPYNIHAGSEQKFLTQELRVEAFYATTGRHIPFFGEAVDAYGLCHEGNEYFLPIIKTLLLEDKLAEAAQVVSKLGLQSHFSRDEILVPLLLTDRINLIEQYIKGESQQQMLILDLLDHLCARTTDIVSFAQATGLKNIKGEKLNKKSLSKFATRLMKIFDIPADMCPNISDNRAMSAVRFLLYKHYIEKSMTAACWEDMVESVIGENVSIQTQFVLELMAYNDAVEAIKWVQRFKLPDTALDPSVLEAKQRIGVVAETSSSAAAGGGSATSSSSYHSGVNDDTNSSTTKKSKDDDETAATEDWDKETTKDSSSSRGGGGGFKPDPSAYYIIPLKDEAIMLVDTRAKLMTALERLSRPSTVIGIDCEWKPIGATKQVALLQLAVDDAVFLVDFVSLDGLVSDDDWRHFTHAMFCDSSILKIGYSLDTDLRMLSTSCQSMKESLSKMVRVIELSTLARKVEDFSEEYDKGGSRKSSKHSNYLGGSSNSASNSGSKHDCRYGNTNSDKDDDSSKNGGSFALPDIRNVSILGKVEIDGGSSSGGTSYNEKGGSRGFGAHKHEEKGLSRLVRKVIGKPLCKAEQMSNWERRPLRRSQILYAAMDAYVLLEIYKHLRSQAEALGLTGNDLEPPVSFKSHSRVDKKRNRMAEPKKKAPPTPTFPHAVRNCRPHELRVVCDSMLQGLGNQLRSCGVDTLILSTGQVHDDAVQIALRENRIILTTGLPFEQVRSRVGASMCYCVSHTTKAKDQCIDVLQHFKVQVSVDDIFSRCAVCNGAEFAHIPTLDMERLWVLHLQNNTTTHSSGGSDSTSATNASSLAAGSRLSGSSGGIGGGARADGKTQRWFSGKYGIDADSITFLHNSVRVQVETVPSLEAFQTIDVFFVCVGCGKVYWKGSHYNRIQEQFKPVLTLSDQSPQNGNNGNGNANAALLQQQQRPSGPPDRNPAGTAATASATAAAGMKVKNKNGSVDELVKRERKVEGPAENEEEGEFDGYGCDYEAVESDMAALDLKQAGYSGVWKIS